VSLLHVQDLSVHRRGVAVVDQVSFDLDKGECVGLIGANGAGKTTLMRAALGLLAASGASNLVTMSQAARARAVAWLPQTREVAWPVSVETLVTLGRTPHRRGTGALHDEDRAAVTRAIENMGLAGLRQRDATRLSGGEQARVLIARALAQQTPLLIADEPIAGLDPAQQISTMATFRDLARTGHGVLVSIHDLGLAARFCSRLLVIHRGKLMADGDPAAVLTPQTLSSAFGIRAHFEIGESGPVFQPLEVL
jgi:iron complex transport system ATP-binding protein